MVNPKKFPREILLEAIIRQVEEQLLAMPRDQAFRRRDKSRRPPCDDREA
jgi:hypothetical protein